MEEILKILKKRRVISIFFIVMGLITYTVLTMITLVMWQNGQDYFYVIFLMLYMIIQLYGVYHYMSQISRIGYDLKRQELVTVKGTLEMVNPMAITVKEGTKGIVRINLLKGANIPLEPYKIGQKVQVRLLKKTKYLVEIISVK